jgi:hypothetical protein
MNLPEWEYIPTRALDPAEGWAELDSWREAAAEYSRLSDEQKAQCKPREIYDLLFRILNLTRLERLKSKKHLINKSLLDLVPHDIFDANALARMSEAEPNPEGAALFRFDASTMLYFLAGEFLEVGRREDALQFLRGSVQLDQRALGSIRSNPKFRKLYAENR